MVTKDDIQVFFKSDKWIKAELEYLTYHSERLAFVVNIINDMISRNDGSNLEILDIGPHFLTSAR